MSGNKFFERVVIALPFAAMLMAAVPAAASQCAPREVNEEIKAAVLALKATEYCIGSKLPYDADQVRARLEELRCGEQSSQFIDDLVNDYDAEYKRIMTQDVKQIICIRAAAITLD